MSLCPCGSQTSYFECCGLYIEKHQQPETPEQLMRSRYSAYSVAKIDYITKTMKGTPLIHFNAESALKWSTHATWLGLEVIKTSKESPDKGFVEFIASFIEKSHLKKIHEISEFHRIDKVWFYVDGINKAIPKEKIAKNGLCPCNSGKKFKNCHEK